MRGMTGLLWETSLLDPDEVHFLFNLSFHPWRPLLLFHLWITLGSFSLISIMVGVLLFSFYFLFFVDVLGILVLHWFLFLIASDLNFYLLHFRESVLGVSLFLNVRKYYLLQFMGGSPCPRAYCGYCWLGRWLLCLLRYDFFSILECSFWSNLDEASLKATYEAKKGYQLLDKSNLLKSTRTVLVDIIPATFPTCI